MTTTLYRFEDWAESHRILYGVVLGVTMVAMQLLCSIVWSVIK